jgi:hypothetical protein
LLPLGGASVRLGDRVSKTCKLPADRLAGATAPSRSFHARVCR